MATAKIPKSVEVVKIVDSVIELRFTEKINVTVVYSILKDFFDQDIEELPIRQIPLQVRESDQNLKYQATHMAKSSDGYILNIGEYVIGFGWTTGFSEQVGYPGWSSFYSKYKSLYDLLVKSKKISNIFQVGVRYVNLYNEGEFFSNSNINIESDDLNMKDVSDINVGFIVNKESYRIRVIANSNAVLTNATGKVINGEVVDIDAQFIDEAITNPLQHVKTLHGGVKETYFKLLKTEYVTKELRPSYED